MSETKNYGLHLTDDNQERFIDWRRKMNGVEDSNMQKIDDALGEKADSSVSVEGVLLASEWSGEAAPFTQDLLVEGLGSDQNGSIAVASIATPEQLSAAANAIMTVISQSTGRLVVAANGDIPTVDIPVTTILLG